MKKLIPCLIVSLLALPFGRAETAPPSASAVPYQTRTADTLSLAGTWRFAIDKDSAALFRADITADSIPLPGTTQTAGKGAEWKLPADKQKLIEDDTLGKSDWDNPVMTGWTHVHQNPPAAWYQREVTIPESWQGKRVTLTMERTKVTRVWVGDREMGTQDGVVTAQVYDLTEALTPGKHRLTILVKTGPFPPGIGGHHMDRFMQGNWNGIIGRIELQATDPVWVQRLDVRPDVANKKAKVLVYLGNTTGRTVSGELTLAATSWNSGTLPAHQPPTIKHRFTDQTGDAPIELEYPLGPDARLWDEFNPTLYKLTASLKTSGGERSFTDAFTTHFGLSELRRNGTVFTMNGQVRPLRGTTDNGSFPLTAHPPMDLDGWLKIMRSTRDHGLNHVRYHTWTPPQAAFSAADMVGIYLQPEPPTGMLGYAIGKNPVSDQYAVDQGLSMLRDWGNHPSLAMVGLGNEIMFKKPEDRDAAVAMVNTLRAAAPGKLYAEGSNNMHGQPTLNKNDDYWTTMRVPTGQPGKRLEDLRASFSSEGWLNTSPPATRRDYSAAVALSPDVPLIGHEAAQYTFFPNLKERGKYTGVFRLRNYDQIERRMRRNHVLEQNADFVRASGALALTCYKAEIEAYLATPGLGGFQLLDLVDYQGQGTALVGILDAHHESKGHIIPERWREFCSEVVPLARFQKFVWTNDETFAADAVVAHYGPTALIKTAPRWTLVDAAGTLIARGQLPSADLQPGGVRSLGKIEFPLAGVKAPTRLTLELSLGDTPYRNRWPLWVYPKQNATEAPPNVTVARKLDEALAALATGRRVVFFPAMKDIETSSVRVGFSTLFWNFFFVNQPPTMGILCDPKHPALAQFPTEGHTDWQWFNLLRNHRAMVLAPGELPDDYRPVVQVGDNIASCRKLALVWEVRVGEGRLLVCTSELPALNDKPEARQLMASLMNYTASDRFNPATPLAPEKLQAIFTKNITTAKTGRPDE